MDEITNLQRIGSILLIMPCAFAVILGLGAMFVKIITELVSADKEDRIFYIICLISAISLIVGGILIVFGG